MMEEWRPVRNTEGKYEVSNFGRVRCYRTLQGQTTRILAQHTRKDGSRQVTLILSSGRYSDRVGHMVASAFLPRGHMSCTRYKDGDPGNCHLSNIEWGA